MKKKYKLLNDTFIHLDNDNKGYIVHAKESKYIEWIHEGVGKQQETFNSLTENDETFYIDKFLPAGLQDNKSKKKYGIILESHWIAQPVIDLVKANLEEYMNCYDTIFTWCEELVEMHDRIKWIPGYGSYIKEPQIYSKDKLVSIVCSMQNWLPGHRDRLAMVEQLKDYAPWFGKGRGDMEIEFKEEDGTIEKLVHINRVSKTVKGGKRFGFAALVVVGDGQGRVGFGHGKAREVPEAINKATAAAKKSMIRVALKDGRTLHHDGKGHFGAGKVTLRSAPAGTGIIAGGPMRAVFESLGVADVVTKSVGTSNPYNMIRATFAALSEQTSPKSVAQRRGKKIADLLGRGGSKTAEADAEAIAE